MNRLKVRRGTESLSRLTACIVAVAIYFVPFDRHVMAAEFPLPEDMKVTQPSSDVPPDWAAFSGTWEGAWKTKQGGLGAPMMYVVERIYPDGTAIIVYSWANYSPWKWKKGQERDVGTLKNDVLVFKNRHGTYTQKILENGEMRSNFVGKKTKGVSFLKKKE